MTIRTRQEYIDILKSHADVLRTNYGISYMRLFGSVAKDEHHNGSDVDLFVVMPAKAYTLCAAADYLESILGTSVEWNHGITDMNQLLMSSSGVQDLAFGRYADWLLKNNIKNEPQTTNNSIN